MEYQSKGIIQLSPRIILRNQPITPDHIVLQTLVSKWMGPLSEWDSHLEASAGSGYNMIHFAPLQRRGSSDSPYSLYNHMEISPDLFSPEERLPEQRLRLLNEKISWMEHELGLLSLVDVVWNHIACNSELLAQHPEAGYTLQNSKHLKVAYDLDECILTFSRNLSSYGLDPDIRCEADVGNVLIVFHQQVLPSVALWEYFVIDVSQAVRELESVFRRGAALFPVLCDGNNGDITNLVEAVVDDGEWGRFSHKMDLRKVTKYYKAQIDEYCSTRNECNRSLLLSKVLSEYRSFIDQINYPHYQAYDAQVQQILNNLSNRVIYERVADHGPKIGPVSEHSPLVSTYFTRVVTRSGETIAFANNGWIWNADPLHNFAEAGSDAYFTREVIIWGDCVKLRYGNCRDDCPWLWDYMSQYTEEMARVFHGFRIDNCHSTPLHVAEYLLKQARAVRPELYVCAELFTGSEERDMLFVTRLGLNSLIREAMVAWNPAELARLTHKYGGQPTGSPFIRPEYCQGSLVDSVAYSTPHALYMDCTHDNETPAQKRTAEDCLSNAAIVAVCTSAIGSVRGYDDMVPSQLNIVTESRRYPKPNYDNGLWKIRRELSMIHQKIIDDMMTWIEVSCEQDILIVKRFNPYTLHGLMLVARTSFVKNPIEKAVGKILLW